MSATAASLVTLLDESTTRPPTFGQVLAIDTEHHRVLVKTMSQRERQLTYGDDTQFFVGPVHARTQLRGSAGARVAEAFLATMATLQRPAPATAG